MAGIQEIVDSIVHSAHSVIFHIGKMWPNFLVLYFLHISLRDGEDISPYLFPQAIICFVLACREK